MAINITKISDEYSTAPQIAPHDVTEIAQLGFKSIINYRPDQEGGSDQPSSVDIETAANAHGLGYYFIPVLPNQIQPSQIEAFSRIFASAAKPVLGFCKTGNRASRLLSLAQSGAV